LRLVAVSSEWLWLWVSIIKLLNPRLRIFGWLRFKSERLLAALARRV
jgi:hypothetical protein